MSCLCSWSTAAMPMLNWSFHCIRAMVASSPENEFAALGAEIDDEHLIRYEFYASRAEVIESFRPRRVAHAHCDIVLASRQHETLVDARRPVAGDPGGRQASAKKVAALDIELDINRPAPPRAVLDAAHVGWQLGDFVGRQPAALRAAVGSVHEAEYDDAGAQRDLSIDGPVGERRHAGEQCRDEHELTDEAQRLGHDSSPVSAACMLARIAARAVDGNGERSFAGGNFATLSAKAAIIASALHAPRAEVQTVATRSRGTRARK